MRSGSSSFLFQRELGKHRWRVCVWGVDGGLSKLMVRTEESVRSGVDTTLSELTEAVRGGGGKGAVEDLWSNGPMEA